MPNGSPIRLLGQLAAGLGRLQQNLYQAPPDTIQGVNSQNWPSALQPVQPIAPKGSGPLAFQYWMGQNLIYTPRPDAEYSSKDLKALASYPLARICIENVKDVICDTQWQIQIRPLPGETKKDHKKRTEGDRNITLISKFLERPNREQTWPEFARPLLEDLLVIDAPSILIRRTGKGSVVELYSIPGESITRYIDDNGFTPEAPSPAYVQLWEGIPRVNLTTDQLVYKPRNIVRRNTMASMLYGFSPTEQLAPEITIGALRLQFVKAFYTDGSVPGMLHVIPPGVTPNQISEAMDWMNSEMAGNLAKRRQYRAVQGFRKDHDDQFVMPKDPVLADVFDDLHIRKICFGYGTSPQRLMRMMNRATSEQNQESAEVEGTEPFRNWLRGTINYIIQSKMGFDGYEIAFKRDDEQDPEKLANTVTVKVKGSILTINEGREILGDDPRTEPEADQLGVFTATGWVPLEGSAEAAAGLRDAAQTGAQAANNPDDPNVPEPGKKKHQKLVKAAELRIDPADDLAVHPMKVAMETALAAFLSTMGDDCAARVKLAARKKKASKAADPKDALRRMLEAALAFEWEQAAIDSQPFLYEAALAGAMNGLAQLRVTDAAAVRVSQDLARAWSQERAAEMIGMKWVNGELVANPNAKWAISDTTRTQIRELIEDAFAKETPIAELVEEIQEAGAFSLQRAKMIAKTEVTRAQARGNLDSWKQTGVVRTAKWVTSSIHRCCDECDDNAAVGPIPIGDRFPSGATEPGAHPNCNCMLIAVDIEQRLAA